MALPDDRVRPLIHVGYYKTGTTWLQRHLFVHGTHGFSPILDRDPASFGDAKDAVKRFAQLLVTDEAGLLLSPFNERSPAAERAWRQARVPAGLIPVSSNERLVGYPFSGGMDAPVIAARLRATLPHARILIVIRNQIDQIVSSYFQYLRRDGCQDLVTLMSRRHNNRSYGFQADYFAYHVLVERYMELFSPDDVLVLPYEWFRDQQVEFVAELCRFSGAPLPEGLNYTANENVAISRSGQMRTRWLNPFLSRNSVDGFSPLGLGLSRARSDRIKAVASRLLGAHEDEDAKVWRRLANQVENCLDIESYAISNRRLAERTGLDLKPWGYLL